MGWYCMNHPNRALSDTIPQRYGNRWQAQKSLVKMPQESGRRLTEDPCVDGQQLTLFTPAIAGRNLTQTRQSGRADWP